MTNSSEGKKKTPQTPSQDKKPVVNPLISQLIKRNPFPNQFGHGGKFGGGKFSGGRTGGGGQPVIRKHSARSR